MVESVLNDHCKLLQERFGWRSRTRFYWGRSCEVACLRPANNQLLRHDPNAPVLFSSCAVTRSCDATNIYRIPGKSHLPNRPNGFIEAITAGVAGMILAFADVSGTAEQTFRALTTDEVLEWWRFPGSRINICLYSFGEEKGEMVARSEKWCAGVLHDANARQISRGGWP